LQGPHQKSALQAIESEIEHLRRAWEWATERGDADVLQRSAYSLYLFHEMQGRYQDGVALFGAAVKACEARPAVEDESLLGRLLAHWGWFLHRVGEGEAAHAALERGLALAQRLNDREYIPLLLVHLGDAARVRGEYERAESFLQRGLHLYRRPPAPTSKRVSPCTASWALPLASRSRSTTWASRSTRGATPTRPRPCIWNA